jgi:molybdopterin-guanine dinucleotide biosynthesis protein A
MDVTAVVLAGGLGSRIGGDKAVVELGGRPLIGYPIEAARSAGLEVVVVAKRTTLLPALDVPILVEPDEPTHPLLGILTALEHHCAVLAIPCDMPLLDPAGLITLAGMRHDIATLWPGEPLPALYRNSVSPQLRRAIRAGASVRSTQAQSSLLAPAATASARPATQLSVNTPADLEAAEALLSRR